MSVTKTKYGKFKATSKRTDGITSQSNWYVEADGWDPVKVGTGKSAKKVARTLAALLDHANVHGLDALPPGFADGKRPDRFDPGTDWELWATEQETIPVEIARAGKPAMAAWLKVVYRRSEKIIGTSLDVSESTIRQYLSDLRQGQR